MAFRCRMFLPKTKELQKEERKPGSWYSVAAYEGYGKQCRTQVLLFLFAGLC